MIEFTPKPIASSSKGTFEAKQPRRLLLALGLLLVALAGVLIHDHQFWFGDGALEDADATEAQATHPTLAKSAVANSVAAPTKTQSNPTTAKKQFPANKNAVDSNTDPEPTVTRTVLPPLDVEVVAGDNHKKLHPGSNATKLEISNAASAARMESALDAPTTAAERAPMATAAMQAPAVDTSYPLLAQQMKVQGSVILQAVIGADGVIQNLRVVSGPGILSSAAQQAVREWRFKPIMQNGQPVESQARITVNFTIKVADGSTKTTLAESRTDDIRILSR